MVSVSPSPAYKLSTSPISRLAQELKTNSALTAFLFNLELRIRLKVSELFYTPGRR